MNKFRVIFKIVTGQQTYTDGIGIKILDLCREGLLDNKESISISNIHDYIIDHRDIESNKAVFITEEVANKSKLFEFSTTFVCFVDCETYFGFDKTIWVEDDDGNEKLEIHTDFESMLNEWIKQGFPWSMANAPY